MGAEGPGPPSRLSSRLRDPCQASTLQPGLEPGTERGGEREPLPLLRASSISLLRGGPSSRRDDGGQEKGCPKKQPGPAGVAQG